MNRFFLSMQTYTMLSSMYTPAHSFSNTFVAKKQLPQFQQQVLVGRTSTSPSLTALLFAFALVGVGALLSMRWESEVVRLLS